MVGACPRAGVVDVLWISREMFSDDCDSVTFFLDLNRCAETNDTYKPTISDSPKEI
jgi:hypothetical protein